MTFSIGTPHTKGAGYVLNNQNLNVSQREEADVQTCAHCRAVIKMQEWKKQGAWCPQEMKPICIPCGVRAQTHGCEPFLKWFEAEVAKTMRFHKLDDLVAMVQPTPPPQPLIIGAKE